MIFAALNEAAQRGELILVQDGLCRWHKRRDGVVVIHEILVLPFRWGTGVGKRLLMEVRALNPGCVLRARCPREYAANTFWEHMGFRRVHEGKVDTYEWHPPSSTAPTGTLPLPVLP